MNTNTRTRLHAFCLRGVTLSAADAPRLETRLRAILATGTTRRNRRRTRGVALAATIGLAGLLAVVRPAAPDAHAAPPVAPNPTIVAVPGTWTQTVDGVTLELVAVADNAKGNLMMWKPDGTPLAQPLYKRPAAFDNPDPRKYRVVEYVLKPQNPEKTGGGWLGLYGMATDARNSSFNTGGVYITAATDAAVSRIDRGYRIVSGLYPRNKKDGTVRVEIAAGPWTQSTNIAMTKFNLKGKQLPFAFPVGKPGASLGLTRMVIDNTAEGLLLTATDHAVGSNYRIVIVDKQGREHAPSSGGANSNGIVRQSNYYFHGLLVKDVQTVRFQTRPYQTVEFRNVPLAPKTN